MADTIRDATSLEYRNAMATTEMATGTELHLRRLAAGLPVHQVASRLGLSSTYLEGIESNLRDAPVKLIGQIREAILELSGGYWDPFKDEYLTIED